MAGYSYGQLEQLWISAGGPSAVAPLMAAIGLAESRGQNIMQSGGGPGCGIWQITPAEPGCLDAATNARQAVRKYNEQGLSAWTTYTNGAYRDFYRPNVGPSVVGPQGSERTGAGAAACCLLGMGGFCADTLVGLAAIVGGAAIVILAVSLGGLR